MAPSALSYTYCTQSDVEDFLSADGVESRLDDQDTGDQSSRMTQAINWATERINLYCLARYAASDLANSWLVLEWCGILAAHWLSCRRGNPAPGSIKDLVEQTYKDLEGIRSGEYQLPGVGLRTAAYPAWSNLRLDSLYALRKLRVERPISEKTPQAGPFRQYRDIPSDIIVEPN